MIRKRIYTRWMRRVASLLVLAMLAGLSIGAAAPSEAVDTSMLKNAFSEQRFSELSALDYLPAKVSFRADDGMLMSLDKGEADGVQPEMFALAADGLLGQVIEVREASCTIQTILDPRNMMLSLMCYNPQEWGGQLGVDPASGGLLFNGMMPDSRLKRGDMLYTEGGTTLLPEGIRVGQLASDLQPDGRDFPCASFTPSVDVAAVEDVYLLAYVDPLTR